MNDRDEAANLSLEQRLRSRLPSEPDDGLKQHILRAVNLELTSNARANSRDGLVAFLATMAATLIICLNLSLSAASSITLGPSPVRTLQAADIDPAASAELNRELSPADAAIVLTQLHSVEGLPLLPEIHTSATSESAHADDRISAFP